MFLLCGPPPPVTPHWGLTEPFSAISHALSFVVFAALAPRLLAKAKAHRPRLVAVGLFVFAALLMFAMSTLYHVMGHGSAARAVMLRLDHASIFILIASSVTVLHTILFAGWQRWGVIACFWVLVGAAVTMELVFLMHLSKFMNTSLFLTLGGTGVVSLAVLVRRLGWSLFMPLVLGGASYALGAVINQMLWPTPVPGVLQAHDLFHLFVTGGVALHWRFFSTIAAREVAGDVGREFGHDVGLAT
jgi:channel protein (hemolysin III family)